LLASPVCGFLLFVYCFLFFACLLRHLMAAPDDDARAGSFVFFVDERALGLSFVHAEK
jgi:hypothetical protein